MRNVTLRKLATLLVATALLALAATSAMASNPVRISQIFGANNASNAYNADFAELFNDSGLPVTIGGWTLIYGGSTNTSGFQTSNVFQLPTGSVIPACGYFLIQCQTTATGRLPVTPDAYTSAINLHEVSGKVALINTGPSVLPLPCLGSSITPPGGVTVEDLIGYGPGVGVCWEGAGPAPSEAAFIVLTRNNGGKTDTDNSNLDWTATTVTAGQAIMHNSHSVANPLCDQYNMGACCLRNTTPGACVFATAAGCQNLAGVFLGVYVPCDAGVCATPTSHTTWGKVKILYR
jgi:hypothetical protein